MAVNSTIVPYRVPQKLRERDETGVQTPVTDAERVVIRFLARRAARRWVEASGEATDTEHSE
jgi:hypothetical protein